MRTACGAARLELVQPSRRSFLVDETEYLANLVLPLVFR